MRILLADSNQLFTESLKLLLAQQKDMTVVGVAATGQELFRMAMELKPHLIVTEIQLPGQMATEVIRKITEALDGTEVIVLTTHEDEETLFTAIDSNASGYVLKSVSGPDFIQAVRTVYAGGYYLSAPMVRMLAEYYRGIKPPRKRRDSLTYRELQVLKMIAEGSNCKGIAGALELSVKTIEAHKFNLMRKLDIHCIANLTRYAIQMKIVHLEQPVSLPPAAEASDHVPVPEMPERGRALAASAPPR